MWQFFLWRDRMKTAVVDIGGNAILKSNEIGTKEEQLRNLELTCTYLAKMIDDGYDIVFTHGNGPQVGNILIQNEGGKKVPSMPLDVCVAESQGEIGYMLQQTLTNKLAKLGIKKSVVSVVSQVVVDKTDPAFKKPTKPIGPYFSKTRAKRLMKERKWKMIEDPRGGYRRVVPSPKPIGIVEKDAIRRLIFGGKKQAEVVIAAGGGGIPVIKTRGGYKGVEAVIDKDLATSVLATSIDEKLLIFLTDVDKVALNYQTPQQTDLDELNVEHAKRYLKEGQFPHGTMGPKIEAAIEFLEKGGKKVIITSPKKLKQALKGNAGTHIIP